MSDARSLATSHLLAAFLLFGIFILSRSHPRPHHRPAELLGVHRRAAAGGLVRPPRPEEGAANVLSGLRDGSGADGGGEGDLNQPLAGWCWSGVGVGSVWVVFRDVWDVLGDLWQVGQIPGHVLRQLKATD